MESCARVRAGKVPALPGCVCVCVCVGTHMKEAGFACDKARAETLPLGFRVSHMREGVMPNACAAFGWEASALLQAQARLRQLSRVGM